MKTCIIIELDEAQFKYLKLVFYCQLVPGHQPSPAPRHRGQPPPPAARSAGSPQRGSDPVRDLQVLPYSGTLTAAVMKEGTAARDSDL